jgi:hypothetical protein
MPAIHAQALRYGCAEHGILINYRPVATPHYGGHIERLIGTLMGKVHLLPVATCNRKRLNLQSSPLSDRDYLQLKRVQTGIICN